MVNNMSEGDEGTTTSATGSTLDNASSKQNSMQKWKGAVFLGTLTGFSLLSGFGLAVGMAKKKDSGAFTKGLLSNPQALHQQKVFEGGAALATRALAWGTLYSVGGFSLFCFTVWKLMGVNSLQEFTAKIQSSVPKAPKKESDGKTDFKTAKELVDYIIDEGKTQTNVQES